MSDTPNWPSRADDETRILETALGEAAAPNLGGMPAEVDGYRLLGVLGQGGMGVVYLAEQKEPRRRVALKVIRGSAHTDSLHVRLFRREAETLGRLRHPNIGAIYGAGRMPDGRPYFAMELVEGSTLDAYLASRPSPNNRAELQHRLILAGRIAEAVNYAHQRGVIHRDLKPANIVIPKAAESSAARSTAGEIPDVKVLDFGLARITDEDSEVSVMSDVGTIRGTLAYMSPEQVRGEVLDVRSDVYTLGVILFEMLAGQRPYDVSRASLTEAMRVINEQEPKPLRDTPSGLTRVDADLQAIVLKALAKEPERRYSSAAALAEDLERYRNSQPVLAQTPSAAYQLRKLVTRHKTLVTALSIALVAIVVSAVVSTVMFVRARTEAAKSQQVAAFLGDMLQGVGPSVARGRDTALMREILDRTAGRVRAELSAQPDVAAGIEHVLGRTYFEIGDLATADQHAAAAYEAHQRVRRAPHEDLASDLTLMAEVKWQRGQLAKADSLGREALTMWRALHKGPHSGTAEALINLGGIQLDATALDSAEPLLRDGLAMTQALHPEGDRLVATGLNSMGNLMHARGRFDDAESLQRQALAMHRRIGGDLNPDVVADLLNLGQVEVDRGRFDAAESLIKEAIDTERRIHPESHPDRVAAMISLSGLYVRTGNFARAEELGKQALDVAKSVRGGGEGAVGAALQLLGVIAGQTGRNEEALARHQEALATLRRAGDAGAASMGTALDNLAQSLSSLGRFDAAEPVFREAITMRKDALGPANPATLLTMNNYARMKFFLGEVAAAEALFREVLDGRQKVLGEDSDQFAVTMSDLARAVLARGRIDEAETLFTRAYTITKSRLGAEAMNTNFVYSSLARVHGEQGHSAKAATELREVLKYLVPQLGEAQMLWATCELANALGAEGPSAEADALFAKLARAPLPPNEVLRFNVAYGKYLTKVGRHAEAEKHLLAAEQALRQPREGNVRRRLDVLETLVVLERAWADSAPSPARSAALARWTAARDAEVPELKLAITEGRVPRPTGQS